MPLTRETPKPLLPIWNVPNLERVFALLREWHVREVLVNVHHRADRLFDYIRTRPADGLRISLSFEPEILGTGGGVRKAEWFVAGDEPVWVVNGDVVLDVDPRPMLRAYQGRRVMAAAWVHASAGPRTVEVERGFITNFRSPRAGTTGTFTFCGVQLLNPRLLDRRAGYLAREPTFESLIEAYERARADGWRVAGVEAPGSFWADIGTPAQLLACHRVLVGDRDFAAVHPAARLHPKAEVVNSVVCENAVLGPRARVTHAIVAPNTTVNGVVGHLALPAVAALDASERSALLALRWTPESTTAMPLGPRGSSRSYTRLAHGKASAVLVHYDAARRENTLHAKHTRFLRRLGLPVPRVLVDRPRDQIAIFEDLGDESLLVWQRARSPAETQEMYVRVLEVVLRFHERGVAAARHNNLPLMPAFRPRLYRWEREYFADEMLRKREKCSDLRVAQMLKELAGIGRRLARGTAALVHRDLQSSNILISEGRPWLIDYQGMRYGPAAYDLASLLCDPYVELPASMIRHLLDYYVVRSRSGGEVEGLFPFAAVQRLAQALGAFARLGAASETRAFAEHIPAARRMMSRALREVPGCSALRAWCDE